MSNPRQISVPKNDFIEYKKVTIIGNNKTIYNKLILIRLEYDIPKRHKQEKIKTNQNLLRFMTPNLTGKQRSNLTQKVSLIYFQNLNLIPNQTKVNKLAKQEIKTQINKIRKHPKPSNISHPFLKKELVLEFS